MADFKPTFSWLLQRPVCFLGFGFGSGLAPKAPGTFGTLPALPITALLSACGMSSWGIALLCLPLFAAGVYICGATERELGIQDYGGIVWDEIVAMMLVLAFVPPTFGWWLAAFIVFRLFDALKPWPIKWFDARLHGGFGIMWDDIIAALFSLLVLQILQWLF
ncbi:MAG: phosphatidylglycerophosphatase A [Neisseria sp.]|nr:phosphatidylglycerophosphatase A [Neisseria sp.]